MQGQTKNSIDTPRLLLRRFEASDLDDLAAVLALPEVMRFSLNGVYTKERTRKFITDRMAGYRSKGYGLYAVIHKADQKLIGYCGLIDQEINGVPEVEVGYRLHPDYWGRGLGTEAAKAARDHGFNQLGFTRLISIIEADNLASIKVALKNGMKREAQTMFQGKVPVDVYAVEKQADGENP